LMRLDQTVKLVQYINSEPSYEKRLTTWAGCLPSKFLAVAGKSAIDNSAIGLRGGQPSLSQAIKNVEEFVGVPLLS